MTHTLTCPAARGLFQAIVENPFDDVPRLLLADVLEEAGEGKRAEFIRAGCELAGLEAISGMANPENSYSGRKLLERLRHRERELLGRLCVVLWRELPFGTRCVLSVDPAETSSLPVLRFRRGFVASVTLTLADWCGSECPWCHGKGRWRQFRWEDEGGCPNCHGTGRKGGHGPALVLAAPLEQVILSDREPGRYMGSWGWFLPGGIGSTASQIPSCLFDLIEKKDRGEKQEAVDDLSRAALEFARKEAGLRALTRRT